ncbi:hypothetical protein ACO0K9_23155 [Undibacterium sp. Ji50W]|uniref:hypothetical protein n=1 Tax=Undibacterium sp. Ji50W TaxID=3413041 RepID=UPI003BF24FA9
MINLSRFPSLRQPEVKTILSLLAAAVLSTACVTTPYVAPQSGPVADLAVRITAAQGQSFNLYIYDDAESCSGAKTVIDDAGKVNISATKLVADKWTTFGYFEVMGKTSCKLNFSFVPRAGHAYVLDAATGRGGCGANIVDATDAKAMFIVPLVTRSVKSAMCLPLKK